MEGINFENEYVELKNKLKLENNEYMINMPNEIFNILQVINKSKEDKKGSHIAFAYSYIYFYTWLYRYTKYYYISPTTEDIKEILGYSTTNKTMNYLIKKNGLLEQLRLLESTTDYPVRYEIVDKRVQFETISGQDEYTRKHLKERHSNNYTIKLPIFAFEWYKEGEINNGTFYDANYTHIIDFNVFLFCMANERLGCTAFFLYSYITMKNEQFHDSYKATATILSNELGIGYQTVIRYEKEMRKHNMINVLNGNTELSPSIHKIKNFDEFTFDEIEVKRLQSGYENKVSKWLDENYKLYSVEKTFDDLKGCNGGIVRYDFALYDNRYKLLLLIEVDGEQHFFETNYFNNSFNDTQENDIIKNEYCIDNNIPLIRLPYWEIGNFNDILENVIIHYNSCSDSGKNYDYNESIIPKYLVNAEWNHDKYIQLPKDGF